MSVLVEAINVIVRKETLERKFPGGVSAYERNCPNGTYCADDHLTRVGFLSAAKTQTFLDQLAALGFVFFDSEKFADVAVVDKTMGLTAPCEWLKVDKFPEGFARCWLAGTEDQCTVFPTGRTPENIRAANRWLLPEDDTQDYEFKGHEGEYKVLPGQLSYTARIPNQQARPSEAGTSQAIG